MTEFQLLDIRKTQDIWKKGKGGAGGVQGRYEFTAYLAEYSGGDWDAAHQIREGKIVGGALPNLVYVMREWTRERLDAKFADEPLNLANGEILDVRPPFILFTGTRDFVLTEAEVKNLRRYLIMGGAIWGDSNLPGRDSRFDIAFRREMHRVIGDVTASFAALDAPEHPIFRDQKYRFSEVPAGVNHFAEPIEAMQIFGVDSIFYTANDYTDMMQIGMTHDGEIDLRRDANNRYVATNGTMWHNRDIYFRNLEQAPIEGSYQLVINLTYHLLTRWEERLQELGR
jgi:hypothetical protein